MNMLKSLIWRVTQLIILPMTVYAGIYFNGMTFNEIYSGLMQGVAYYPSLILPSTLVQAVAGVLAFIPSLIAHEIPVGFTYNHYVFGLLTDHSMIYLLITLFFATTRAPEMSWLLPKKVAHQVS